MRVKFELVIHETMVTLMEGLNAVCEFWFSGTRDYEVLTADLRTGLLVS